MLRVVVDRSKCVSHGQCELYAPSIFEIDVESGDLVVLDPTPGGSHRGDLEKAVDGCPTAAISVIEDPE